jgi:DNA-binding NarL/FixJ family response regulator
LNDSDRHATQHRRQQRFDAAVGGDLAIPASSNASLDHRCDAGDMRCLIVDDNASFREAAATLLERQGLTVVGGASTAEDALQQMRELRPDVVLVDIMLGSENGLDLARRLAEDGWSAEVILVSTHPEADFGDLVAETPAAGFVQKSELSAAAIRLLVNASRER